MIILYCIVCVVQVKAESKAEAKAEKTSASTATASAIAVPPVPVEHSFPKEMAEYTSPVTVEKLEIIRATTTTPSISHQYLPSQPGLPALQSSRMYLVDNKLGPDLAKSMITKMHAYLREMHIPERPVATKRVCDLVDIVRKDTLALISLHNVLKKKEKDLQNLKSDGTTPAGGATATATTTTGTKTTGSAKTGPRGPRGKSHLEHVCVDMRYFFVLLLGGTKSEKGAPKAPKTTKSKKETKADNTAAAPLMTTMPSSSIMPNNNNNNNDMAMHDSFELNLHDDHDLDLLDVFDSNELAGELPTLDNASMSSKVSYNALQLLVYFIDVIYL